MKMGVVSDTHSLEVPAHVIKDFQSVDLIIHVGDFSTVEDYKFFTGIQRVKAVYGNMDEAELRRKIPRRDVFEFGGLKFGLYHGEGSPEAVLNFVINEFKNDKVDVVIFGHSHRPFNEMINGVLYFNPGSLTDVVRPPFRSYGILEVKDKQVTAKIIKVDG